MTPEQVLERNRELEGDEDWDVAIKYLPDDNLRHGVEVYYAFARSEKVKDRQLAGKHALDLVHNDFEYGADLMMRMLLDDDQSVFETTRDTFIDKIRSDLPKYPPFRGTAASLVHEMGRTLGELHSTIRQLEEVNDTGATKSSSITVEPRPQPQPEREDSERAPPEIPEDIEDVAPEILLEWNHRIDRMIDEDPYNRENPGWKADEKLDRVINNLISKDPDKVLVVAEAFANSADPWDRKMAVSCASGVMSVDLDVGLPMMLHLCQDEDAGNLAADALGSQVAKESAEEERVIKIVNAATRTMRELKHAIDRLRSDG
ncbi:hypothetical protein ACRS5S_09190 [Nocardia asiatica]|uniref:hypothetical protein n=1 Tax=Nocardia asiatica TaxID=209252 RepID=UPI003EE3B9CC